ncbi:ImmA/IrrE family metallo-endopeptidase [Limnoglobus roseus]|uniref:ImmA/IrrE family metallo-endopeptidase n=1 Tax=Limnoglobus roseus TaxID=2598579 RepID=A0A5C1A7R0_9BACT|nr:ImmA/IrrE family metallo-endopeptidase [Limnoglobus roseus]QEL15339.1 ImmA/IrrE family metallo-endopeptidase [Limnoglobus roseus]
MIPEEIAHLRSRCKLPFDPSRRGPVLLSQFFEELNLSHVALPNLSCGAVTDFLRSKGMAIDPVGEPDSPLAGCLFWVKDDGWAFVTASDILPRRRFSAAHELGHAVLHRETMGGFISDVSISETDAAEGQREREANQFAAELLMPKEVCWARAEELERDYKACPRMVLAYRLASELLVSREAMRYRLKSLGIGNDD